MKDVAEARKENILQAQEELEKNMAK